MACGIRDNGYGDIPGSGGRKDVAKYTHRILPAESRPLFLIERFVVKTIAKLTKLVDGVEWSFSADYCGEGCFMLSFVRPPEVMTVGVSDSELRDFMRQLNSAFQAPQNQPAAETE